MAVGILSAELKDADIFAFVQTINRKTSFQNILFRNFSGKDV